MPENSYTTSLFLDGTARIAQKVGEEGVELALARMKYDANETKNEAADLLFHMMVLLPVGRNENGDLVSVLSATVDMGSGSDGGVFEVTDAAGHLIFSGQLPAGSGNIPVVWDGEASDGSRLPPGEYNISARIERGGDLRDARVYGHDTVISVAIGNGNQVTLNLASGRSVDVSDVKEFF